MITGIRDLDRKILEYVNQEDYLALLLTNKYICSLFDDIFFRNRMLKEFGIHYTSTRFDVKAFYILYRCVNNMYRRISDIKIGITNLIQ